MLYSNKKNFIFFIIKFLSFFLFFYYLTLLVIGLASPGGYYSSFIENYFDYVKWLRISLIKGASVIAYFFGYTTVIEPGYLLRVIHARGVIVSYNCVGYGVMSFWMAFVFASQNNWIKKLLWSIIGVITIWIINITRIGLFLVSINKGWDMPLHIDHHTWFTLIAYSAILGLIFFYDRRFHSKNN